MGRIYTLLVVKGSMHNMLVNPSKLVLCYTHGNELRQIHLSTGAPHGVNPSLIIC